MKNKLGSVRMLVILGMALMVIAIAICCLKAVNTARMPFAGLHQETVLYDDWFRCPNGDGNDVRAYQLYPFKVDQWIRNSNIRWVRGPVHDRRFLKAFEWSRNMPGQSPDWPYEQWLRSDAFYFYLEDYEEFDGHMHGIVHHSAIWALDTKSYRLYYVSGSM